MLAIAINALYTTVRKRGTTRQLARAIISSVIAALLLLPALLWDNLRLNTTQGTLSSLEIGLMLVYVALFGWVAPFGVTAAYCLFTRPRDSNTAGRLPGQPRRTTKARAEAVNPAPPRRQPGVPVPYVYSADTHWGLLEYRNGKFLGQELALKHAIVSIGREEDNEVWLDDDTISRYHAELAWVNGQVYVTDNDSLNGVLLNGRRIRASMLVKSGDILDIGGHHFALKYTPQADKLDEQKDPFQSQLLRVAQARKNSGEFSPLSERKSLAGPTVALNNPQENLTPFADEEEAFAARERANDIAWQPTAEIAQRTPLALPDKSDGLCIIRTGEFLGRSFLLDRPTLTVGRGAECDIILSDVSISRRHAQFSRQADGDYIQDMASHNGSQLNGQPLNTPRLLHPGDIILLGDVQLEYSLVEEAQTTPMSMLPLPASPLNFPLPMRLPSKYKN